MMNNNSAGSVFRSLFVGLGIALLSAMGAHAQTAATLTKQFLSEPVQGAIVEVQYTLTNTTGSFLQTVGFTDDLDAALTGMASLGESTNSCGGTVSGTSSMTFSRTFMPANSSCSLTLLAQIPLTALAGTYPSTTSQVTGNIFMGAAFADLGAIDNLVVRPILEFNKSFLDDPASPGDSVILEFTLTNNSSTGPLSDITFTDDLNAALAGLEATSLPLSGLCGFGAISGTSLLSFTDGRLAPTETCSFQVLLAVPPGAATGAHSNVTSNISGNTDTGAFSSDPASDELKIGLPVLAKSFVDDPIFSGEMVTLEFTITNLDAIETYTDIRFTDDLDAALSGLDVDTLPVDGFCGASSAITATTELMISGASLGPSQSCTFTVILDVPPDAPAGNHLSTTSSLFATRGMTEYEGEVASAALSVVGAPVLTKSFIDDPAPPGSQLSLEFTITNYSRSDSASNIFFADDLDATLTGLVATGLPLIDPCGPGSSLTGTGFLTLAGGNLSPQDSCTFNVMVDVPSAAAPGTYPNTTSTLSSDLGPITVIGGAAADSLQIAPVTLITLDWSDDPIGTGSTATLDITLTNSSLVETASVIGFTLSFIDSLPTLNSAAMTTCDGDTDFIDRFNPPPPDDAIPAHLDYGFVTPGTLAPGASCTIQLVLDVDPDISTGIYPHASSGVTSTVNSIIYTGPPGSDDLVVVAGPTLSLVFTDNPTIPGGTANLELTLNHDTQAATDATNIGFTIDLNALIPGMAATGLPLADTCGMGSSISGTGVLTFSGGTLAPAAGCQFNVPIFVPLAATVGDYTVESSPVTATVSGLAVTGSQSSDELEVAGFIVSKQFLSNPVIPGGQVVLEFTFSNLSLTETATLAVSFNDDLDAALPGMTAFALPADNFCGTGSTMTGAGVLAIAGVIVPPDTSCSVQVTLQVPVSALDGSYTNATAVQLIILGPDVFFGAPAIDSLTIQQPLSLTTSFIGDPVGPGDTVTLEFTIANLSATESIDTIAFTDNLDAALSGLVATGLPLANPCGTGSSLSGTDLLTFTDGALLPNTSCTFSATLLVPGGASTPSVTNTTSSITGDVGAVTLTGNPATDTLAIEPSTLGFSKAFGGDLNAGGTQVLNFTISNLDSSHVNGLSFSDDLDSVVSGLAAVAPLPVDPCGPGSTLAGTSILTLNGGNLQASGSGSCSFDVTVTVPSNAAAGTSVSTTSSLLRTGHSATAPATDTLTIATQADLSVTVTDGVNSALPGQGSLIYTIVASNAGPSDDPSVSLTDVFPAALSCSYTSVATGGATGNTVGSGDLAEVLSMPAGSSVTYTADCAIDVTATGILSNTATVTASVTDPVSGNNSATDNNTALTPLADSLSLVKDFINDPVAPGDTVMLRYTLSNNSAVDVTGITFSDDLESALPGLSRVGLPLDDICGPGSSVSGTSLIEFSGGALLAGGECTFEITLVIPEDAADSTYTSMTGPISADFGGLSVTSNSANAATASLAIRTIEAVPVSGRWMLLMLMLLLLIAVYHARQRVEA